MKQIYNHKPQIEKKIVCYRSHEEGVSQAMRGRSGKHQVSQEAEGWEENVVRSLYCNFYGKEHATARKQA